VAKQSSQKFIARNRAPRVQIEYDVELYGAEKKVQLPFVMGVMADLAGKRVLVLVPDSTRTAPLPLMFRLFCDLLRPQVKKLDFLIALGTHPPMSDQTQIANLFNLVFLHPLLLLV
jgi:hypothetical protein